ncbi:MAG: mannonate dehydratase [Planctomycetota bacterium]|jgi:mannonate dehydratase
MTHPRHASLRIAAQAEPDPTDEDLALIQQMGVDQVVLWVEGHKACADYYIAQCDAFGAAGIGVYALGNCAIHCQDAIVLGMPNRDEIIELYKQHLRDLGAAGIGYTTHAHIGNGVWSSPPGRTRGGAETRACDLAGEAFGDSPHGTFHRPLSHGREYSEDEIWENYTCFVRQIVPVAEEAGVKIGVHPDDPPIPTLAGVPRCFNSFDNYKRALEIADSPNVGVCLCVGCWLEGGEAMGCDVFEAIRYFSEQGKLFKVHFRNVDQPGTQFTETFLDDGYMDMVKVVKALRDADFDGVLIPDHVPLMGDDPRIGTAYTIGYMKALIERAEAHR